MSLVEAKHRIRNSRRPMRLGAVAAVALCFAPAAGAAASAYEQIVAPIFQARCASCHGEEKKKARLALHTWELAEKGGDSGPLWVAGKPDESELIRRLRLPADEEEHMPPSDEPQLSADQIALLERWIERGASRAATVTELQLSPALASAAAELSKALALEKTAPRHTERPWELDAVEVEKTRAPLAAKFSELQQRFPGALTYESRTSATMHFTAAGLGRDFRDEDFAALAALKDQLVVLDLSGTAVTDRSAALLAGCKQLRVLRLGFSEAGDATVAALAGHPTLEVLALHHSRVTPASVPSFKRLPALQRLHLGVTPAVQPARDAGLPVVESGVEALVPVSATTADSATPRS